MFLRAGYHGATVEAVAAEAGFTIGAAYSRFRGKAELFLALLERRVTERIEQLRTLTADVTPAPAGDAAAAARAVADGALAVARQWAGERGVFAYGPDAIVACTLGRVRTGLARLQAAGPLPPGGVPMAMVAAASAVHATRAPSSLFSGDLLDVTGVPVTLPVPRIVDRLNAAQPFLLQGYPSAPDVLARERRAGRLRIVPRAVTAGSEQLTPAARERITAAFGVPVVDQFGATEGVLGVSAPGDPVIVLAGDLAIVELVDADLRPVPPGETAAAALVTNLMNPVQPLIRSVLPDRFTARPPAPEHGHPRVTVEGRADEPPAFGDVVVRPQVLGSELIRTPEVVEYQLAQTGDGVDVAVVAPGGVDAGGLAGRLAAALAGAGLPGPSVRVRPVDGIARDPRPGKVARFVRLGR